MSTKDDDPTLSAITPREPAPDDPYRDCPVYLEHGACVCSTGYPASCQADKNTPSVLHPCEVQTFDGTTPDPVPCGDAGTVWTAPTGRVFKVCPFHQQTFENWKDRQ